MSIYKRGINFPNEGFVQKTIESFFKNAGYKQLSLGYVDFACINKENEKWVIEAKGDSNSISTDFNTGLGQILKRMNESDCRYALAVPKIPKYVNQIKMVPNHVRSLLNLYWILVDESGQLEFISPNDKI